MGTYGPDALSSVEREPLVATLFELYKNDPDAGVHGAAEWTLRQWKQQANLKVAEAELSRLKDRGRRRWYVNAQTQTFTVIEGPVEFQMGSRPTEPDRGADEIVHRELIPRRFAIASKEVSVEQYQKFVQESPQFGVEQSDLEKYARTPDSPVIGLTWFAAVAYCNWLSKQEGLPPDQWCYAPNDRGKYDWGMTTPTNVLQRKGYRLPSEAEWEYACRAGAITSRYYGVSLGLLGKYARYQTNSQWRTWPCALTIPNDLGLFDMLGNAYEWCGDRFQRAAPGTNDVIVDRISEVEYVDISVRRVLRGGTFYSPAADVRAAARDWSTPADRDFSLGIRAARTCD